MHNDAVKSMRYPSDHLYKNNNKKKDGDKELDDKTIEEIIKEMEEDYDE